MAKKIRGKGEGTIHKRPNGTWRTQITQQSRRLSHTAKTRQEVQQWLDKTRRQIEDGMTYASTMITLEEHLASWLLSSRSSKLPSTWKHYNSLIQIYVNPQIGHFKIKDLRPDHIQVLYDYLLQQDVGVWTVIKIHTMLHSALTQAVKLGIISRNPASNTMPPKEPTREMCILDENQVSQLLIAARDTFWETLLHLAVTTGMRQMELQGLKWTDLDLIKQTLKVERQLDRHRSEGVQFTQPKTRFGRRTVALGTQSIEILRSHNKRQHAERKDAGDRWQDHGLIFTTRNGTPIHPRNLLRDFKELLHNAGLPEIRFHDLRHTAASLMLNHGVPVIAVSRRLGYAKPSITLGVYGHLLTSMQAEFAEMIDTLVTPIELHQSAPNYTRSAPDCTKLLPHSGRVTEIPPYLDPN